LPSGNTDVLPAIPSHRAFDLPSLVQCQTPEFLSANLKYFYACLQNTSQEVHLTSKNTVYSININLINVGKLVARYYWVIECTRRRRRYSE
jgi:hypothetical protein